MEYLPHNGNAFDSFATQFNLRAADAFGTFLKCVGIGGALLHLSLVQSQILEGPQQVDSIISSIKL